MIFDTLYNVIQTKFVLKLLSVITNHKHSELHSDNKNEDIKFSAHDAFLE